MIPFRSPRTPSDLLRSLAALLTVLALVAGCTGPAASSTPTDGRSSATSAATHIPPTAVPSASPIVTPSVSPSRVAAHWEAGGTMQMGRPDPRVVRLGDGRVLVLGNYSTYRQGYDSTVAELWDPATGKWQTTVALNKARGEYVSMPLLDGRAFVAGGINEAGESYSSTYLFDPRTERWEKTGLLGTARAGAAGALLHDGRVLVAGGGYYSGFDVGLTPGAILAGYSQARLRGRSLAGIRLADVDVPRAGYALATAELFDPAAGTWSPTGPMRYARVGASAVTLRNGRVLVWGSQWGENVDERAIANGEVYDPATGRFSMVAPLPGIDRSSLEALGVPIPEGSAASVRWGTLVPLADGDALLVGSYESWGQLTIRRIFRFAAATDGWVEVGQPFVSSEVEVNGQTVATEWGVRHPDGVITPLADGSVLFAGGYGAERVAGLLDPATGAWSSLPPMPAGRQGGAAVTLADGSVLIVGGSRTPSDPTCDCVDLVADALRFIPGR